MSETCLSGMCWGCGARRRERPLLSSSDWRLPAWLPMLSQLKDVSRTEENWGSTSSQPCSFQSVGLTKLNTVTGFISHFLSKTSWKFEGQVRWWWWWWVGQCSEPANLGSCGLSKLNSTESILLFVDLWVIQDCYHLWYCLNHWASKYPDWLQTNRLTE